MAKGMVKDGEDIHDEAQGMHGAVSGMHDEGGMKGQIIIHGE